MLTRCRKAAGSEEHLSKIQNVTQNQLSKHKIQTPGSIADIAAFLAPDGTGMEGVSDSTSNFPKRTCKKPWRETHSEQSSKHVVLFRSQ